MLRNVQFLASLFLVVELGLANALAEDATKQDGPTRPESRESLEKKLAERLTGSTLVGHFTAGQTDGDGNAVLTPEKYTLGDVRKLEGNQWLFSARIQYGDHDVTLPLTLPVEWAGDTPVIVVDQVGFPGLGTYTARVLIYEDRYAGFWQGADHGGHLFGKIE